MSIVLQSSGGGSVTIQEPVTASNLTATLPAATGTVMVSGNMPAFRAFMGSTQTISLATDTKVAFNTESFDTNSCFDTSLFRFTPNVAGYYQVNISVMFDYNAVQYTSNVLFLFKNGVESQRVSADSVTWYGNRSLNDVIFMNGSTDYLEVYGRITGGSGPQFLGGTTRNSFSATLVRGA